MNAKAIPLNHLAIWERTNKPTSSWEIKRKIVSFWRRLWLGLSNFCNIPFVLTGRRSLKFSFHDTRSKMEFRAVQTNGIIFQLNPREWHAKYQLETLNWVCGEFHISLPWVINVNQFLSRVKYNFQSDRIHMKEYTHIRVVNDIKRCRHISTETHSTIKTTNLQWI